jgi:hypothetical protein
MRQYLVLLATLFTAAPGFGEQPPSYEQAMEQVRRHADEPEVRKWIEEVGKPFWSKHLQSVFMPCLQGIQEGVSVSVRLLVEVSADGKPLRFIDEEPSALSACVKEQLGKIDWPKPPIELRYFPIELNVSTRKTDASKALDDDS